MNIICFDPGNHTGWCWYNTERKKMGCGGTIMEENTLAHLDIIFQHIKKEWELFGYKPVIVIESFNLYPNMSKHLAWNSFYPVEVIGIIKFLSYKIGAQVVMQQPSVKKFAGKASAEYVAQVKEARQRVSEYIPGSEVFMEHTKDAIQHLQYYLLAQGK